MIKNKEIADNQPLPSCLMTNLPVNYFLLVKSETKNDAEFQAFLKSDLHMTESYSVYPFYKSISTIL